MSTCIKLPDLLVEWPFKPICNPHYKNEGEELLRWVESYRAAFDAKAVALFRRDDGGLFGALVYPRLTAPQLRIACSMMHIILIFDELTDKISGHAAYALADIVKDALRNPDKPRPSGEPVLGEMAQTCWLNALKVMSPSSARRFLKDFIAYMEGTAQEAEERACGHHRNSRDYLDLRRHTIACRPSFDMFMMEEDIPDSVMMHPAIEILTVAVIDMTVLSNDIYSYDKEQARGTEGHNMVSVIMREKGFSLQEAVDYVGDLYLQCAEKFLKDMKLVPTFSESMDKLVDQYISDLHNWVTGNIEYHFASLRYFGVKNEDIRTSLALELRPKRIGE